MDSTLREPEPNPESLRLVAWVGLDWADQEHHVRLQAVDSSEVESCVVAQRPEALQAWVGQLRARFPQGYIAVALEQSRGALIYAWMGYDFLHLYPLPARLLAEYRKAFFNSGAKSDPQDAELALEVIRCHRDRLRVWAPGDALTRQIGLLVEQRRQCVDDRTRLTNRLTGLLKQAFPQALDWAGELSRPAAAEFLAHWPSLDALQQATPSQQRQFYRSHFRMSAPQLEQRLEQIRQARPLTTDPAVLSATALLVSLLATQLQSWLRVIEHLEKTLARLFAQHPTTTCGTACRARVRPWRPVCSPLSAPTASATAALRNCSSLPESLRSRSPAASRAGCIGVGPVLNFCARVSRSSRPNRFDAPSGRELTTSSKWDAVRVIRPPCAPWLSNGFAFSTAAGRSIRPTTSRSICRPCPWRSSPLPLSLPASELELAVSR